MRKTLKNQGFLSILTSAAENDPHAQKKIYEMYSPKMLGVCRQYIKDIHFAEDMMIEGFVKVFHHLKDFRNQGSFEGWIRRIMVNQCITFLRRENKNRLFLYADLPNGPLEEDSHSFDLKMVQELIDRLPAGYKMIFLLYVIEEYSHKEIAEILQISINTSKSQLSRAKQLLRKNYNNEKRKTIVGG